MGKIKKIWYRLNMAAKLILVFSIVSVIPLIFSSQIASDMNAFVEDYDSLTRSLLVNEGLMENLSTDIPISEQIENKLYYREIITKLMTMEPEILSVTILNEQGEYYQYDRNGKTIDYDVLMEQTRCLSLPSMTVPIMTEKKIRSW